ncbi:MAG: copper resistance CopC family protein, partial [Chloroflexota bacterium]
MQSPNVRRWALSIMLAAVLTLGAVHHASAHAELVRSDPAPNAMVPSSPGRVRLWFSEPLDSQFNAIVVSDSSGKRRDTGVTLLNQADRWQLFTSLQQLEPGAYSVRWRSVSTDGHVIAGAFTFGVGAGTRLDASPAPPETGG